MPVRGRTKDLAGIPNDRRNRARIRLSVIVLHWHMLRTSFGGERHNLTNNCSDRSTIDRVARVCASVFLHSYAFMYVRANFCASHQVPSQEKMLRGKNKLGWRP